MISPAIAAAIPAGRVEATEVVRACALCHSADVEQVDWECNLRRCRACGYVFDSPRPSHADIVAFYSQVEKYDSWVNELAAREALWRRRLKMLLPHSVPGNLLDVGTGIGQFLHVARPYFTEVEGTEVSDSAIRIAQEKYGLNILRGQVEDLKLPDCAHDNITLFHVLEHVPDPGKLTGECYRLLRPGGVLAIAVPNDAVAWGSLVKRMGKRLRLPRFRKFSRVLGIAKAGTSREIHLSHFTQQVLRKLVANCGFSIVEEGLDPYYASDGLRRVADTLYYCFHRMLFLLFGLNRYETIWLVARKPSGGQESGAS